MGGQQLLFIVSDERLCETGILRDVPGYTKVNRDCAGHEISEIFADNLTTCIQECDKLPECEAVFVSNLDLYESENNFSLVLK